MAIKKSELYSSLWQSCDELRGGMDASQYKDYVLVLLFVKYVSDKYAGQKDALLDVPKASDSRLIRRKLGSVPTSSHPDSYGLQLTASGSRPPACADGRGAARALARPDIVGPLFDWPLDTIPTGKWGSVPHFPHFPWNDDF
jgi:hypothetical protein